MFKAFRKITEHVSTGSSEDADDKKHIHDIATAAQQVKQAAAAYAKGLVEHTSRAALFHQAVANLYPAGQSLSGAVGNLAAPGRVFDDAKATAANVTAAIDAACAGIATRCKELLVLADTRQVARLEMTHYREKVVKLANDGLADPKKQAKAETNQEKLAENQRQFRELDSTVSAAMSALDGEIAAVMHQALSLYMQEGAKIGTGLVHCYGSALSAAAEAPAAPLAAAGGASAASAAPTPESEAFALHAAAASRDASASPPAATASGVGESAGGGAPPFTDEGAAPVNPFEVTYAAPPEAAAAVSVAAEQEPEAAKPASPAAAAAAPASGESTPADFSAPVPVASAPPPALREESDDGAQATQPPPAPAEEA